LKNLNVGNHLQDDSVDLSGLYCSASAQRVIGLVESALAGGAKLLLGNKNITDNTVVQPHVLSNVTPDMDIWYQETFGPVLTLTTFKNEEEAVNLANDTDTSLCASVFSADVLRAMKIGRQLRTGSTHINGPTIFIEPSLPNGGTGGASGYGRFGGASGIHEFTDERIVTLNEAGANYPLVK
jgi:acyl-CoA reductase-like NAD-dependent aldehyde dehydrogenase